MATYAIGDVQGCFAELMRLLERIGWQRGRDRLWFVGDLVNRGPQSLETLRFIRGLGAQAVSVLGNHDLHMLASAYGARPPRRGDTFGPVLDAPDGPALLDWVRGLPLLHHDPTLGFTMVHAGLAPQWDLARARACAAEVEAVLRGADPGAFLGAMYGDTPDRWDEGLQGMARLRFITNALTRTRFCDRRGALLLGRPRDATALPWFAHPQRRTRGQPIVFGHWATLERDTTIDPGERVYHVDKGCVWGQRLTALRLEDLRCFEVPCSAHADPS